ncbi:MAG: DNA methyltransferase, partial [Polyangiaceae bacterium]|nr:DNA methyltransferase [Polyangiaceae bacterium]
MSEITALRRPELTYRANLGNGRHGWLRLTPAYSVRLVSDLLAETDAGATVLDPFSGTGTTALCAAERGASARAIDVNPFLVWLGNAKLSRYEPSALTLADETARAIVAE